MSINNAYYDEVAGEWWDDDCPLSMLRTSLNPGRFKYFRDQLEALEVEGSGHLALDVGCGGGFLAEEFAQLGFHVTGLDPSAATLETARGHAEQMGLSINYEQGVGESLPFESASFDLVYCCDVLEHVNSLDQVIAEISRVLKPGGYFFFDTINRTWASYLLHIKVMQDIPLTRLLPRDVHVWDMFIKPKELELVMDSHGMRAEEFVGLSPKLKVRSALDFLKLKTGGISSGEFGRRMEMKKSRDLSGSYMGYAVKFDN